MPVEALGDFPLGCLGFQESNDLEAAERCFRNEEAAIVRQLVDGKKLECILGEQIDIVRNAAFHDFAILEREPDPEVWVNGERVEEAYILLRGAAGEGVDEENRLGILETECHRGAAVFRARWSC